MVDGYDVAQICVNGHVINSMSKTYPEHSSKHCDKCGAETITQCTSCKSEIRGFYHVSGVLSFEEFLAPKFCPNCGKPYPWTEASLKLSFELTDELDELSADEKVTLKASIQEMIKESPNAVVAQTRFKKITAKVGKESLSALKEILVGVLSDAIKKTIFS